jgi:hypothetical protein
MEADRNTLSIAAFTALGTIVGYLGTEVACSSIFNRLLWPSRFYNTKSLKSFSAIVLLMPMGGPIHKAAVEALDMLVSAGLWKGYCRGDMLGTAFYKDTGHHYIVRTAAGSNGEKREARNAFWITVLGLIPWQPQTDSAQPAARGDDASAEKHVQQVRAQRPVHILKLSRANSMATDNSLPVVNGDIGPLKFRHLLTTVASEIITLSVGIITATVWKSLFSIWYLAPLLLKLIALFCRVRRNPVDPPAGQTATEGTPQPPIGNRQILCEAVDYSKGFFLIEGPPELVLQFFRHYGHPIRNRRGLLGDRVKEVTLMSTVIAAIAVYPGGLIGFIFAPVTIQWIWLGYQLYTMLAMHVYRFGEGEYIGTTEEWIATELFRNGKACFDDGSGNRVIAQLESSIVSSVAEGREEVERLVQRILQNHAEHKGCPENVRA